MCYLFFSRSSDYTLNVWIGDIDCVFLVILWSVYCDPTWHHIAAANLLIGCSRSCSRFGLFELSLVLRFHCKALPFRQAAPRAASCIQNGILLPGWLWTQLGGLADVLPLTPTSFLLNWYSRPLRCALYWVVIVIDLKYKSYSGTWEDRPKRLAAWSLRATAVLSRTGHTTDHRNTWICYCC